MPSPPPRRRVPWHCQLMRSQATVVTFTHTTARVVQAICMPLAPEPALRLSLRASYYIGDGLVDYNPATAREILRWIVAPADASPAAEPHRHSGAPSSLSVSGTMQARWARKDSMGVKAELTPKRIPSVTSSTSRSSRSSTQLSPDDSTISIDE